MPATTTHEIVLRDRPDVLGTGEPAFLGIRERPPTPRPWLSDAG